MIKALVSDDIKTLEKELQSLPSGSIIRAIYGHHGRHVAWVILPAPKVAKKHKGQNGE